MTPLPKRPKELPDPYSLKIERILIQYGKSTHRSVRRLLLSGKVSLNGKTVTSTSQAVDTRNDRLIIDGEEIPLMPHIYIMLNKEQDTVCSSVSGMLHKSVLARFPPQVLNPPNLPPLHITGRLDADTEGLLILTTDGNLSHYLTDPEKHISKTYLVFLRDYVPPADRERYIREFQKGVTVPPATKSPSFTTKPAELEWVGDDDIYCTLSGDDFTTCRVSVTEGKFHQIKRMFLAMGNEVVFLKRIAMGGLFLDQSLLPGQYRPLTDGELSILRGSL